MYWEPSVVCLGMSSRSKYDKMKNAIRKLKVASGYNFSGRKKK